MLYCDVIFAFLFSAFEFITNFIEQVPLDNHEIAGYPITFGEKLTAPVQQRRC